VEFGAADRLWSNPLRTAADARAAGRMPLEPDALWLRVLDGSDLVGLAAAMPPRGVLLSDMPDAAATALADFLSEVRPDLPTLNGPSAPAAACTDRFAQVTGRTAEVGLRQRMLATSTIAMPAGVLGAGRAATVDDEDLILDWLAEFTREALPDAPPTPPAPIRHRLTTQPPIMWFWEDGGQHVSFCWQSMPSGGVVRVSLVYTPPEFRGRGYAAANVAAVSQRALDTDADRVMLYTDAANPVSNRVYERIGYEYVGDATEFYLR
jgi:GNAT superfamily N-acetyltransferase